MHSTSSMVFLYQAARNWRKRTYEITTCYLQHRVKQKKKQNKTWVSCISKYIPIYFFFSELPFYVAVHPLNEADTTKPSWLNVTTRNKIKKSIGLCYLVISFLPFNAVSCAVTQHNRQHHSTSTGEARAGISAKHSWVWRKNATVSSSALCLSGARMEPRKPIPPMGFTGRNSCSTQTRREHQENLNSGDCFITSTISWQQSWGNAGGGWKSASPCLHEEIN